MTTARNLARMARVSVSHIHQLVKAGVILPTTHGKPMRFNNDYAKRLAPLISVRCQIAHSRNLN